MKKSTDETAQSENEISVEKNLNETLVSSKQQVTVPILNRTVSVIPSTGNNNKRNNLMKRRYKSGIPLSNDRNDEDSVEELYLKQFNDSISQKQSKDDSGLPIHF